MSLEIETVGGVTSVKLPSQGLSDLTAEQLAQLVAGPNGPAELQLDFGGVPYLDSLALGKLVGLHRKMKAAGGRLTLLNVGTAVLEVIQASRLDTILEVRRKAG